MDLDDIRTIPDPVARIRAVTAAQAEIAARQIALSAISRDTVREMRKTMSYGQIAKALGVSRGRVQQLER